MNLEMVYMTVSNRYLLELSIFLMSVVEEGEVPHHMYILAEDI